MFVWVVADDLTGANEVGTCFAQAGFPSFIPLGTHSLPREGAVIRTSESRHLPPEQAREVTGRLALQLKRRPDLTFKKIDSTLRGNVGVEIEATMSALDLEGAVLAPALPSQGRTTIGGYQLVSGVPVHYTSVRHDPLSPVREAHIPTLLESQAALDTLTVSVDVVDKGHGALLKAIQQQARKHRVYLVDAATDQHLATVAEAAYNLRATHLTVGTSGLARKLAQIAGRNLPASNPDTPPAVEMSAGILFVCGSLNPVTLTQATRLSQTPGVLTRILDQDGNAKTLQVLAKEIIGLLHDNHVLIHAPRTPKNPKEITEALARITTEIVEEIKPKGVFITGGETAHAVLNSLGAEGIVLVAEVANAMPAGYIRGGQGNGIPLVTKAGGFGRSNDLVTVLEYFQHLPGPIAASHSEG